MWEDIFVGVAITVTASTIIGLAVLAWKDPDSYKRTASAIYGIGGILVFLCMVFFFGHQIGSSRAFRVAEAEFEKLDLEYTRLKLPWALEIFPLGYFFLAVLSICVFLWVLTGFRYLKEGNKKENGAKNEEISE